MPCPVAPVFSRDGVASYYLPAGRWMHFLSGEVKEGPGWVREMCDYMSLPLLVRPNAVVAVGSRDDRPDYDYSDGVTVQVYELADRGQATAVIPSTAGDVEALVAVKREGHTITVERRGNLARWRVLLVGVGSIASVEGGTVESSPQGVIVAPRRNVESLIISLDVA